MTIRIINRHQKTAAEKDEMTAGREAQHKEGKRLVREEIRQHLTTLAGAL